MTASLEDLSQTSKRTAVRFTCVDGNQFEMPAVDNIDVSAFMCGVKANGWIGTPDWFLVYDAIVWATKVVYVGSTAVSVEGMVKQ